MGRHAAHAASHSLLALTVLGGAAHTVQVRDGKVANVTAKKAGEMLKEGWVLLDVRPQEEIAKASGLWLPAPCNASGGALQCIWWLPTARQGKLVVTACSLQCAWWLLTAGQGVVRVCAPVRLNAGSDAAAMLVM